MRVADVMSRGVDPVDSSASVQQAAMQMAELDVGAVLVGTREALEGILTDRDIILRLVVDGRGSADVAVQEIMSSTLFTCKEDDAVESILAEMRERQIRRMPVLGAEGRLVGIVTMSDLAKGVSGPEQVEETLREISEPHRSRKPAAPEKEAPPEEETGDQDKAAKRG